MNRRECLQSLLVSGLVSPGLRAFSTDTHFDPTGFVDLRIGTGGHGHTTPAATVPFGAVQLGPDTGNTGWDHCSGYHNDDRSLMGFSHTHLSGTGIGDLMDVLVVPGVGQAPLAGKPLPFSHSDEQFSPGYYSVQLRDPAIRVELTATERTGLHRYHFPAGTAYLLVDAAHGYAGSNDGHCRISEAFLEVRGNNLLVGKRKVQEWAKGRELYFALEFSSPFVSPSVTNNRQHATLSFPSLPGQQVLVRCGISGVSIDGALRNLRAEMPGWNFEEMQKKAREAWRRELSRVEISTKRDDQRFIFYTALYHSFLAPTLFDDIDGQYRGMDGSVHQLSRGEHNWSTYSLWDTYRACHPLFTLLQQERVPDMVNGLIRMGNESPQGAPVWPLQGKETGCMTGYHSAVVIAEAAAKRIPGIRLADAWPWLSRRADVDDYRGLAYYRKLGYIPADRVDEAVSKTLEYAYDDWAVASIAKMLGKSEEAERLTSRSRNYEHQFDRSTSFMRARLEDGSWAEPFDPRGLNHWSKWRDFTECNAWQATFLVQQNPAEYIRFFGGPKAFESKLDGLFNASSQLPPDAPDDIAGLVGQYAHGNEPSHHIAYLYTYAGAPHKTQKRVRQLLETMYRRAPDGLAGNEDCGQMSAWYALSALGFYPVDPVSATFVIGTPLFDEAKVQLANGRVLTIEAQRNADTDCYVTEVLWNGRPVENWMLTHAQLSGGGRLQMRMGATV